MTRQEIKQRAKNQLSNSIFSSKWLFAVLAMLIVTAISGIASVIVVPIGTIAVLVITGPLSLGITKMFLKQARDNEPMDFGELFKPFSDDFKESFLLGLMITVFTFLWSLLFIVPGIVKACGYSMAFYIRADHPEYTWKECLDQSQIMMNGHKSEYFVLILSFFGWLLVGSFCFGIGTLWVEAYMQASFTHFYESIK